MSNLSPMGLTRDSHLWWLTLVAAVLSYLAADGRPPTDWTYTDWLKAGVAVSGWAIGKMQTSPLAGKDDA